MTLPKPTRPAPPMPVIKQPAVDYRALLVRYMARVIDAESVSFVDSCGGLDIILTPEETEELLRIEIEAIQVARNRDCAARGGVLVKGALQYVCVPAVQVKP